MDRTELLEGLIESYSIYYDVERPAEAEPFVATARFCARQEQYFLTRAARLSETESNEFVFFAQADGKLDAGDIERLSDEAWEKGLSDFVPCHGHRSSDVILIIVADSPGKEAMEGLKHIKRTKSYKLGFYGFSLLKLAVVDANDGKVYSNAQGHDLKKQIEQILRSLVVK